MRSIEHRLLRLREIMHENEWEAFLISQPFNRRYLSGFTGTSGMLVITQTEAFLITDFRYLTQAKMEAPQFILVDHTGEKLLPATGEWIKKSSFKSLAFEATHLTFQEYQELQQIIHPIELLPTSHVVEALRIQKDEQELAWIRQAVAIADQAFSLILEELTPGMTERYVAFRMEALMRELGAEAIAFDTIVASGKRSALPHGRASDKKLEKGDLVTLDFGVYYKGYASDLTRTIVLGQAAAWQKEIYELVLKANQLVIEQMKVGMTGKEVDAVARHFLAEHGYEKEFGHATGHGLGLDVHEPPRLGRTSVDQYLLDRSVVTVEPGIYIPDMGGVRIEDDVWVTQEGCEVLSRSEKKLLEL